MISKKHISISILLILCLITGLLAFKAKHPIEIVGFAYKNDIIRITQFDIDLQKVVVDSLNKDSDNVCNFYKEFSYYKFGKKSNLKITIDSANYRLLDTTIQFSNKTMFPVVSFENPSKTKFKRKFFIMDKADKEYIER